RLAQRGTRAQRVFDGIAAPLQRALRVPDQCGTDQPGDYSQKKEQTDKQTGHAKEAGTRRQHARPRMLTFSAISPAYGFRNIMM
ncbi:hypothetical protein ACJBRB_11370, partial [Streptococcus suis]